MNRFNPIKLGEIALNDTKPRRAMMAFCYLYQKAEQILGKTPMSLAHAVLTVKKHQEGGSQWK